MSTTKHTVTALASPALYAGALAVPLVIVDALAGVAFWQDCDNADLADIAAALADEPCADDDAITPEQAHSDVLALLALSDIELDALDATPEEQEQLALIDSFPDGLGWDWPGTDWNAEVPF